MGKTRDMARGVVNTMHLLSGGGGGGGAQT